MGSTCYCNNCPGDGRTNVEVSDQLGFPQQIQGIIDGVRNRYKQQLPYLKNQKMPNGKIFRGNLTNGKKNGYGQFYNGNNAFFGMFQNDFPEGEGVMIKNFKDYIRGNFNQGKPNGEVKQKVNRSQFQGYYLNGQKTKGVLSTDEYVYQGGFKQNKFDGYGTLKFANGDRYEGDFHNGLYNGFGKYETKDQGSYYGEFKNGIYDGKGTFKWRDDYFYQGYYKNGVRNGFGKFIKGKQQIEGSWINGQPLSNSKFLNSYQLNETKSNAELIKA